MKIEGRATIAARPSSLSVEKAAAPPCPTAARRGRERCGRTLPAPRGSGARPDPWRGVPRSPRATSLVSPAGRGPSRRARVRPGLSCAPRPHARCAAPGGHPTRGGAARGALASRAFPHRARDGSPGAAPDLSLPTTSSHPSAFILAPPGRRWVRAARAPLPRSAWRTRGPHHYGRLPGNPHPSSPPGAGIVARCRPRRTPRSSQPRHRERW